MTDDREPERRDETRRESPEAAYATRLALSAGLAVLFVVVYFFVPPGTDGRRTPDPGASGDAAAESWRLESRLAVESPENDPFVGVLVDELGRMYARLSRPPRVRVYGRDGRPVRTLGRSGGAAELDDVRGMTWGPGPELWIVEGGRFVVFDTAGTFVRELPRRSNANARRWQGAGFDERGRLYDKAYGPGGSSNPVLVRLNDAAEPVDTLPLPQLDPLYFSPGQPRRIAGRPGGDDSAEAAGRRRAVAVGRVGYPIPHSPTVTWAFDPRGFLWVARSDGYRIRRRSLTGDTVMTIEREVQRRPVSPAEKLEIQRSMRRRGEMPDTARIPSFEPVIESLFVDPDGRLWVRLTGDIRSPATYDVFGPRGEYRARVETGVGLRGKAPVVRGDDFVYFGAPPGKWPPPETLGPITNHLVWAKLVKSPS